MSATLRHHYTANEEVESTSELSPHRAGIPAELRARAQWVTHRAKVPYCARRDARDKHGCPLYGTPIDVTRVQHLAGFDEAWDAAQEQGHDGVGYSVIGADPYVLVDLDGCVRPDGSIVPLALDWVQKLDSYAELSPSGTGLHVVVRARLREDGTSFLVTDPTTRERFKVEVFTKMRYVRLTGCVPAGLPTAIADGQEAVSDLHAWLREQRPGGGSSGERGPRDDDDAGTRAEPARDDQWVLARARNARNGAGEDFRALYDRGDTSADGGDDSKADWHLLRLLAYWTQDPAQLDRLFRRSALMREEKWRQKWGDSTYGARTIQRVLERTTKRYVGRRPRPPAPEPDPADEQALARARWKAFSLSKILTQAHRQSLIHLMDLLGLEFGMPLPAGELDWVFLDWQRKHDDNMQDAPATRKTYEEALEMWGQRGVVRMRWQQPAGEGASAYRLWSIDPDGLARFYAELLAGTLAADTPTEVARHAQRQERDGRAHAEAEAARDAMHRATVIQLSEAQRQRDQEQQRAEMAIDERNWLAEQVKDLEEELEQARTCTGCGAQIPQEHRLCPDCRNSVPRSLHAGGGPEPAPPAASSLPQEGLVPVTNTLLERGVLVPVTNTPLERGVLVPVTNPLDRGGGKPSVETGTVGEPASGPPRVCRPCGGTQFWQLPPSAGGDWRCARCHPQRPRDDAGTGAPGGGSQGYP